MTRTSHAPGAVRLACSLLLLAGLAACGPGGTTPGASVPRSPLRAVATTGIVGDVLSRVGGDLIQQTTLMGTGVEPHTYVPTPGDVAAIHDAQVLFLNGAGLEEGLQGVVQDAGGSARRVDLADGLQLRSSADGKRSDQATDPHVWFDVHNVIAWVGAIEQALSAADPANQAAYQANAQAYRQELEALDAWIVQQVAAVPPERRKLVTNHLTFGYFADRYGFEQLGAVYPISPSSEPSARDLAALQDLMDQHEVPALFTENTVSSSVAEQIAPDTQVRLVPLFTDSLGGPGSGAESYVDLMRYDVQAIVEALK